MSWALSLSSLFWKVSQPSRVLHTSTSSHVGKAPVLKKTLKRKKRRRRSCHIQTDYDILIPVPEKEGSNLTNPRHGASSGGRTARNGIVEIKFAPAI
jgi:hypothetical protein